MRKCYISLSTHRIDWGHAGGEDLNKAKVAYGAFSLMVGLVVCLFGAVYAGTYLAWMGVVPGAAWTMMVFGTLSATVGLYTCLDGTFGS